MSVACVVEGEENKLEEGLQREDGEKKVVLSLSARTPIIASSSTTLLSPEGLKLNLFKANPVKRRNPVKQSSAGSSAVDKSFGKRKDISHCCREADLIRSRLDTSADRARGH